MASGSQGPKQSNGYFVPLGNCVDKIFTYKDAEGAGGSFRPGNFTRATWTAVDPPVGTPAVGGSVPAGSAGALLSTIASIGAGGLLRDMGKTVVSSNRTFRKVQLVTKSRAAGVTSGGSDASPEYRVGYIELGSGNALMTDAAPAPVAYLPGLLM